MESDPRRRTTSMAAAMGLMLATTYWGTGVTVPQSRIRRVAVVEMDDPPEVQQAAMSAAEEKRQRRAERNKRIATQERQP